MDWLAGALVVCFPIAWIGNLTLLTCCMYEMTPRSWWVVSWCFEPSQPLGKNVRAEGCDYDDNDDLQSVDMSKMQKHAHFTWGLVDGRWELSKSHWFTDWMNFLFFWEEVGLQVFLRSFLWITLFQTNRQTVSQMDSAFKNPPTTFLLWDLPRCIFTWTKFVDLTWVYFRFENFKCVSISGGVCSPLGDCSCLDVQIQLLLTFSIYALHLLPRTNTNPVHPIQCQHSLQLYTYQYQYMSASTLFCDTLYSQNCTGQGSDKGQVSCTVVVLLFLFLPS